MNKMCDIESSFIENQKKFLIVGMYSCFVYIYWFRIGAYSSSIFGSILTNYFKFFQLTWIFSKSMIVYIGTVYFFYTLSLP